MSKQIYLDQLLNVIDTLIINLTRQALEEPELKPMVAEAVKAAMMFKCVTIKLDLALGAVEQTTGVLDDGEQSEVENN